MKKKIILLFICLIVIIGSGFYIYNNIPSKSKEPDITIEEKKEPEIETTSLSLIMGGDAVIHGAVYLSNNVNGEYDFYYPLSEIKEIVEPYDLAYYNQETILGGKELGLSHYPQFNSPKEVGDGFIDAGFNIVSLANNHTLDGYYNKGNAYVLSSLDYWKKQNGVITAGSYSSYEDRDRIVTGEKNGISYALLSYTYGTNGISCDESEEYLVNYIDREKIKEDVLKYRDKVDLLLVAIHWGNEYRFDPTDEQKDLAQFLADLDVDIVIGNHAHVIEPIEKIGDTLVFYAFGNIISAQYMTGSDMYSLGFGGITNSQRYTVETLTGILGSVNVTKTTIDGKSTISIEDIKAQLIYTDYKDRWKVYPYSKLTDDILPEHNIYFDYFKEILNKKMKIEVE